MVVSSDSTGEDAVHPIPEWRVRRSQVTTPAGASLTRPLLIRVRDRPVLTSGHPDAIIRW